MSSRTELQKQIIDYANENPDASPSKIAKELGCSASWARETRRKNLESIVGETDLYNYNIAISYSNPYSIFASEEIKDSLDLSENDLAKIEITNEDYERETKISTCKNISEINVDREFRAQVYAIEGTSESLPETAVEKLSRFIREDNSQLEIYSESDFSEFLDLVRQDIEYKIDEADLVVGADLLSSSISPEESDVIRLSETPILEEVFGELYGENDIKVIDIRSLDEDDDIIRPDEVYFVKIRPSSRTNIKEKILSHKYFDSTHRYLYGIEYPISGPQTLDTSGQVIEVDENNLELTIEDLTFGIIHGGELTSDRLRELTENLSIEADDEELQVYRTIEESTDNPTRFVFFIGSYSIQMFLHPETVSFLYPTGPDIADHFINALIENISNATDVNIELTPTDTIEYDVSDLNKSNTYVFDTNAIYNNVHTEQPESILRSFFNNREFDGSNIRIPWPVLYEINKHKEKGGPGPRVQEQGIENLKLLKLLDEHGFLSVHVENIPKSIKSQVGESDIADMHILQCTQEQEAVLISGDARLREIASLSDVVVVDIQEIVELPDVPEISEAIQEEVLSKVGTELEKEDEIITAIENEINQYQQQQRPKSRQNINRNPDDYLTDWVNEGDLVPVIDSEKEDDDQLLYDRGNPVDVVLTPTAAGEIVDEIVEFEGNTYLNKSTLEYLTRLPGFSGPGLPSITFHVPLSSVIAPQSTSLGGLSTTARQFYKLRDVRNIEYESSDLSEAVPRDEYIHDAVLLSRENDYPLLCAKEDGFIDRIAGLMDLEVFEYEKED